MSIRPPATPITPSKRRLRIIEAMNAEEEYRRRHRRPLRKVAVIEQKLRARQKKQAKEALRQLQKERVKECLARGLTYKETAQAVGISYSRAYDLSTEA